LGRPAKIASGVRTELRLLLSLRVLPPRVAVFCWRARRHAMRSGDRFSLDSATRPAELAQLLELAGPRTSVVELGTGTGWSAIALALHVRGRRVVSCDPFARAERDAYLHLAGRSARARIELRPEPDTAGPRPGDAPVQLLFVDSSHEREATVAAFRGWRDALAPGAVVVFHDHGHPSYPGVREAVADLQLSGREAGGLFVWRAPG
jgi:predicted O-methyltransferase YrrM